MKKYISFLFLTPIIAFADVPSTTISMPAGFTSDIWGNVQALFNGFAGYIALVIGVILAAVVLDIVIGAIRK